IYGSQVGYRDLDEAVERIGRVLATELPDTIERYRIVTFSGHLPMVETVVDAADFISAARYDSLTTDITSTYVRQQPAATTMMHANIPNYRGFYTGLETFWIQSFGSPEAFYMYQGG